MEYRTPEAELNESAKLPFEYPEYFKTLGIQVIEFEGGNSVLKLPFHRKLIQPHGIIHGGALFSLADSACALALLSILKGDKTFVTAEMKINFLERVNSGDTYAYAKVLREGRVVPIEVELENSDRLVAKAISTYIILDSKK